MEVNKFISPKKAVSFSGTIILQHFDVTPTLIRIKRAILVNVNGASRGNPGHAGCGGILREHNCSVLMAFSEYLGTESNNFAEMSALYTGLIMCYQTGYYELWVETDSSLLQQWFSKKAKPPWRRNFTLLQLKMVLPKEWFQSCHGGSVHQIQSC